MKQQHYEAGLALLQRFCTVNRIPEPSVVQLGPEDRLYHLATCAYYRPTTVTIMVSKCAAIGRGGMAWSCPGYKVDRTPYGVLQHELGHHVDYYFTEHYGDILKPRGSTFARALHTGEKPLTGYLGTNKREDTFYAEWFAEHFRLFVTNPQLSRAIAPKWYELITRYLNPVELRTWDEVLVAHGAPQRTLDMAAKLVNQ